MKKKLILAPAWLGLVLLLSQAMFAQAPSGQATAAPTQLEQSRAALEQLIAQSGAEKVGLAVVDLASGQSLFINADESFHAASTMKLPVMMEIFRQAQTHPHFLQQQLLVKNQFASIVDGSSFALNPADDSDPLVFRHLGKSMAIRLLTERMITWSSNLATNLLIEQVTATKVMELIEQSGATGMVVRRGVEDNQAFRAGLNNTTTARALSVLLRALAEQPQFTARARQQMLAILKRQHFNQGIPAGLPRAAIVAHKTGSITKHNHDAALVYLPRRKPYIFVVLTRGLAEEKQSSQLIAALSRKVYESLSRLR